MTPHNFDRNKLFAQCTRCGFSEFIEYKDAQGKLIGGEKPSDPESTDRVFVQSDDCDLEIIRRMMILEEA